MAEDFGFVPENEDIPADFGFIPEEPVTKKELGKEELRKLFGIEKSPEQHRKELQESLQIIPFMMPTGVIGGVGKAIEAIPMIGNALKATVKGLESRPLLNALSKLGIGAGEAGLAGGVMAPTGEKERGAEIGAGLGAGTSALTQLARTRNPIVNMLSRAGLGAGAGYAIGGPEEVPLGAAAGIASPSVMRRLGLTREQPGSEVLEFLKKEDVLPAYESGLRLKTPLTPAEAAGSPYSAKMEAGYGRYGEAAAEKERIGKERVVAQKNAINDLLKTIYGKTPEESNKIRNLYQSAYKWQIKPNVLNAMKEDPVIAEGFRQVERDPIYKKKLIGVNEGNLQYLDQVKRAIGDMEQSAIESGKKDKARIIGESLDNMVGTMDKSVPDYKLARQEAQKSILRNNIEKMMRKKDLKGSTFYNTVLKNENEFNKLINDLKHVPEAQNKLHDMRLAWKDLIDLESTKGAAAKRENYLDKARGFVDSILGAFDEMFGIKRNVKSLKYINSPEWIEEFSNIQRMKDKKTRNDELSNMIGRLAGIEGISALYKGKE